MKERLGTMKINTKSELLEIIKEGKNTLEYVKDSGDIEFISKSIVIERKYEDSFYEETAEVALRAIIYYVMYTQGEEKAIYRCKEISKMGTDNVDKVKEMMEKEDITKFVFFSVKIASDKTI